MLRWFGPKQVWTNGVAARDGCYGRLLAMARARKVPVLGPGEIARVRELGGAQVRLLWPRPGQDLSGLKSNDRSLWLGFGLNQAWLWLPGDGGPVVER